MEEKRIICRGDIYWTKFKPHIPVIVVSNDTINDTSDHVLVVPMTKNPVDDLDTHCTIRVGGCSTALVERLKTMKKEDLGKFIDTCSSSERMLLDLCLVKALALDYLLEDWNSEKVNQSADEIRPEAMATTPEEGEPEPEPVRTGRFTHGTVDPAISVIKTGDEIRPEDEPLAMATTPEEGEPEPVTVHGDAIIQGTVDPAIELVEEPDQQDAPEKEQEIEVPIDCELDRVMDLIEECANLETELAKAKAREEVWDKVFRYAVSAAVTKI